VFSSSKEFPDLSRGFLPVAFIMKKGGHGVENDIIRSRFDKSLKNLIEILPFCDDVNIYDNSKKIEGILSVKSKELLYIRETIPSYLKSIINEYTQTITI